MRFAGRYAMYSSGISELVLVVKDVLSSARFYEEVVGLTPEKEVDDEWAWFWAGTPGAWTSAGTT
jgi:catechol-2,3-dioxygenase